MALAFIPEGGLHSSRDRLRVCFPYAHTGTEAIYQLTFTKIISLPINHSSLTQTVHWLDKNRFTHTSSHHHHHPTHIHHLQSSINSLADIKCGSDTFTGPLPGEILIHLNTFHICKMAKKWNGKKKKCALTPYITKLLNHTKKKWNRTIKLKITKHKLRKNINIHKYRVARYKTSSTIYFTYFVLLCQYLILRFLAHKRASITFVAPTLWKKKFWYDNQLWNFFFCLDGKSTYTHAYTHAHTTL